MDTRVTDLAERLGVRNYIIYIPLVYGPGLGFGHRLSVQIPAIVQAALQTGQVHHLTPASLAWPVVHVEDLSRLYLLLGQVVLDRSLNLPYGKRGGHFFASTGLVSWMNLSDGIAQVMNKRGLVDSPHSRPWTEQEASKAYHISDPAFVRDIWGKLTFFPSSESGDADEVGDNNSQAATLIGRLSAACSWAGLQHAVQKTCCIILMKRSRPFWISPQKSQDSELNRRRCEANCNAWYKVMLHPSLFEYAHSCGFVVLFSPMLCVLSTAAFLGQIEVW